MAERRGGVMKAKVVETALGWEPAFWWPEIDGGQWMIESGFALPTRAEAQAKLDADLEADAQIEADQRVYAMGYAYACGYRD